MERIITRIEPKENRVLIATFVDGEVIRFDVRTLFERYPVFKVLEDETLFRKVRIDGTVSAGTMKSIWLVRASMLRVSISQRPIQI